MHMAVALLSYSRQDAKRPHPQRCRRLSALVPFLLSSVVHIVHNSLNGLAHVDHLSLFEDLQVKSAPELCVFQQSYWLDWFFADLRYGLPTIYFLLAGIAFFSIINILSLYLPQYVDELLFDRISLT